MKKLDLLFCLLLFSAPLFAQPTHDPLLSLPWTEGAKWWLHHGVHTSNGSGPLSSLDFAPAPGADPAVRAARGGWVVPISDCLDQAFVMLNHGDGYYTSYYHLQNVPNHIMNPVGNVWVSRGEFIGHVETDAAQATPCNTGSWSRPHVHITLRTSTGSGAGSYANLVGKHIGGWEVLNDKPNQVRASGLRKDGFTVHRPSSYNNYSPGAVVYHDGAIGTGNFSTYPHCRDHHLNGVYSGGEKIPAKATQYVYTDAIFQAWSKANIVAGKKVIFRSGFRTLPGSEVNIVCDVFSCSSNPNIDENIPSPSLDEGAERSVLPEEASIPKEVAIKVSPNPFTNQISLEWYTSPGAAVKGYVLFDVAGNILLKDQWLEAEAYYGQRQLSPLNHLSAGLYLLQIQLEDGTTIQEKIIKK